MTDSADAPRAWRMYAGRAKNPQRGNEFRNFGTTGYVKMCGQDPVAVELIEDPDGGYWGWIRAAREGLLPCTYTGIPGMIQPSEGMFGMQFPYGPKAEAERGRGEIVRMSCREANA